MSETSLQFLISLNDILVDDKSIGIPSEEAENDGFIVSDARRKLVRNLFKKRGARYCYLYDFGDDWSHEVTFEKTISQSIYVPLCIEAENACPPDDVGGIGGYEQLVQAYKNNDQGAMASYANWLGLEVRETWRADFCSRRDISLRLALLGS